MASTIRLSSTQNFKKVLEAIYSSSIDTENEIIIDVSNSAFFNPCGIAALANLYVQYKRKGVKITFTGCTEILNYLARMDFFKRLDIPYQENFKRHWNENVFPIMFIEDDVDVLNVCNGLCDFIIKQIPEAEIILEPFEWCINEVIDNIRNHSKSISPGIVCGQYYPNKEELLIAIVDSGIGIKNSLSEGHSGIASNEDAIKLAVERGITRNPQYGQGNGLAGTKDILQLNKGRFHIWSKDCCYSSFRNGRERILSIPEYNGTGVLLIFDPRNGISFQDTFIGGPAFSYLEYLSEQAESSDGIDVDELCAHTRGRATARRLRRRVNYLLPLSDESIKLNFTNVSSTSSSFLDELLGKLIKEMGISTFNQKIEIIGATKQIIDMANVVIEQRMNS